MSNTVTNVRRRRPGAIIARTCAVGILLLAILAPAIIAQGSTTPAAELSTSQPVASAFQLTLADAIKRARAISPTMQQALTNAGIAAGKLAESRAANLPIVSANSQYLYTQGNGTPSARYIANNGVHEYIAQGDVHQSLSLGNILIYRQSILEAALSRDQTEIAQRGLIVTVVQNYAALVAAQRKYQAQQQSTLTARDFLTTTQRLETGGEVAHADVVKAQIQLADSQVTLEDARLASENARVALALMVFPDVNQNYELVDNPAEILSLPTYADAEAAARQRNPALDAAFKAEQAAAEAVSAARAEYLPTMTFDYFYGIDANHFAVSTPSNPRLDPELGGRPIQNLGYSALASLTLPIWNWGATRSKVKSAQILQHQAVLERKFAQRNLIANLEQFYGEAKTAKSEMEIRQSAQANAEESERLTLLQYKAGNATELEVVTANDTLTLERNALADAEARYATALANLATLTGRL